ncbi:hypothetical protein [Nocardia farcinica]|uniref:hypothetical protein n=1 Tax=Nocardia farcinica TaxID=37329 RepID=UPI001893D220|nr:hypothetical protein [Nocardia farcinica]MBF6139755.1 hypothetical protein [Nocardia farcinica]MBF6383024.1 hypothetical protein [Nocardia farcinica]MBF6541143.1 hypothetical protein [Nocardia farcinica]
MAALDCARGANPDFAVLLSGFFAAVDWIREASAPVIFASPPLLPLDFDMGIEEHPRGMFR